MDGSAPVLVDGGVGGRACGRDLLLGEHQPVPEGSQPGARATSAHRLRADTVSASERHVPEAEERSTAAGPTGTARNRGLCSVSRNATPLGPALSLDGRSEHRVGGHSRQGPCRSRSLTSASRMAASPWATLMPVTGEPGRSCCMASYSARWPRIQSLKSLRSCSTGTSSTSPMRFQLAPALRADSTST